MVINQTYEHQQTRSEIINICLELLKVCSDRVEIRLTVIWGP